MTTAERTEREARTAHLVEVARDADRRACDARYRGDVHGHKLASREADAEWSKAYAASLGY